MLADEADFGLSRKEVSAQLEHTFSVLRRRQNDQGGFGYWAAEPTERIDFISVYVMHFLIEAKAAGFAPPPGVLSNRRWSICRPWRRSIRTTLREARIQAYAIYLLTREGVVTTNYLLNLREYLDRAEPKRWQQRSDRRLSGRRLGAAEEKRRSGAADQRLQDRRRTTRASAGISTPRSARMRSTLSHPRAALSRSG